MFGKFLQNDGCMKVLSWMLSHKDGEYTAAIVGIECGIGNIGNYMAILSILEEVGFITIRDFNEELLIAFNKESSSSQLLSHLEEEFNDIAFNSEQISPALAYLTSDDIKKKVDNEVAGESITKEFIDLCKNYKDLDKDNPLYTEIYYFCSNLEENGEFDSFIEKLESEFQK